MRLLKVLCMCFALILCLSANTHASDLINRMGTTLSSFAEEWEQVVMGVGVLYSPSVYEGDDDSILGIPIFVGKYKNFFIEGINFGYSLHESDAFSFSLMGKPRIAGYDSGDSDVLSGMEDRNWSLDAGLNLEYKNEYFALSLFGGVDTLHEHDGYEISLAASKGFFKGALVPRVGLNWQSENLVDYYYGVTGNEIRSGRPSYEGEGTLNYFCGLSANLPLKDNWVITSNLNYEWLGSNISDSPIVDQTGTFSTMLGLAYRF